MKTATIKRIENNGSYTVIILDTAGAPADDFCLWQLGEYQSIEESMHDDGCWEITMNEDEDCLLKVNDQITDSNEVDPIISAGPGAVTKWETKYEGVTAEEAFREKNGY